MEYRTLGRSGFKVPVLTLGTGTFGGNNPLFRGFGTSDVNEATRLVDVCVEAGLNMFDSADVYSGGTAEQILHPMRHRLDIAGADHAGRALQRMDVAEQRLERLPVSGIAFEPKKPLLDLLKALVALALEERAQLLVVSEVDHGFAVPYRRARPGSPFGVPAPDVDQVPRARLEYHTIALS